MEIRGKVVEINLDALLPKADNSGTYPGWSISYRDKDNKLQEKTGHVNSLKFNAALKNGLDNLQTSDNFVVQAEKNDKGYWEWKSIAKDSGVNTSAPQQQAVSKAPMAVASTYATKEERAQTQVYIVRQSSLTNALKLLEIQGNKKVTENDVMSLACTFESFVLGTAIQPKENQETSSDFSDLDDDIPF